MFDTMFDGFPIECIVAIQAADKFVAAIEGITSTKKRVLQRSTCEGSGSFQWILQYFTHKSKDLMGFHPPNLEIGFVVVDDN